MCERVYNPVRSIHERSPERSTEYNFRYRYAPYFQRAGAVFALLFLGHVAIPHAFCSSSKRNNARGIIQYRAASGLDFLPLVSFFSLLFVILLIIRTFPRAFRAPHIFVLRGSRANKIAEIGPLL